MNKIDKLLKQAQKSVLDLNQAVCDADNPWATPEVISIRNNFNAKKVQASFFLSDYLNNDLGQHIIINYALEYRLYPRCNYPLRYWREINYFVEWFIGKIPLDCDPEQWFELDLFMREALLFDDAALVKIKGDKIYRACCVNKDTNTPVGFVSFRQRTGFYTNKSDKLNRKAQQINLEQIEKVLPLNLFYDGIGMYVKCLDVLQIYMTFLTNKWKSISFLNIIPDTTRTGPQTLKWLSQPEITAFYDKSYDPNSRERIIQNDANGKAVGWHVPEVVKEVYDTLNFEIDKVYTILNKRFGKPAQAVDQNQTLTAQANIEQEDSDGALKYLLKRIVKFLEQYDIIKAPVNENQDNSVGLSSENDGTDGEASKKQEQENNDNHSESEQIQPDNGETNEVVGDTRGATNQEPIATDNPAGEPSTPGSTSDQSDEVKLSEANGDGSRTTEGQEGVDIHETPLVEEVKAEPIIEAKTDEVVAEMVEEIQPETESKQDGNDNSAENDGETYANKATTGENQDK